MKHFYFLSIVLLCLGCGVNRTFNGEREGLWIAKYNLNGTAYKSRGRYKNGFERRTWKYFENGKLVKKEVYRDSICNVTYYRNRKKTLEGQTKIRYEGQDLHWFYCGNWTAYDSLGKPTTIRRYEKGQLIEEMELN